MKNYLSLFLLASLALSNTSIAENRAYKCPGTKLPIITRSFSGGGDAPIGKSQSTRGNSSVTQADSDKTLQDELRSLNSANLPRVPFRCKQPDSDEYSCKPGRVKYTLEIPDSSVVRGGNTASPSERARLTSAYASYSKVGSADTKRLQGFSYDLIDHYVTIPIDGKPYTFEAEGICLFVRN